MKSEPESSTEEKSLTLWVIGGEDQFYTRVLEEMVDLPIRVARHLRQPLPSEGETYRLPDILLWEYKSETELTRKLMATVEKARSETQPYIVFLVKGYNTSKIASLVAKRMNHQTYYLSSDLMKGELRAFFKHFLQEQNSHVR